MVLGVFLLTLGIPIVHSIASLVNVAYRIVKLVTFSHFWMNNESPIECVIREVKEELNIFLTQQEIIWQKKFPYRNGNLPSYFMVAKLNPDMIEKICLGEEGQQWKLIPINKFLSSQNVISHLQKRLRIYLNTKI